MKPHTTGVWTIVALAVLAAVVTIAVRSTVIEAVYPVERLVRISRVRIVSIVRGLWHDVETSLENERLKHDLAALSLLKADYERLEVENARLRRALNYRGKIPEKWVAAGVLSEGGGAAAVRQTVRVDKGSLDGVTKGAVVVASEGLVGRVRNVTPHTAEIALLYDASLKVACEIETRQNPRPRGILFGGDENELLLGYADIQGTIPAQSRVLTSGLGGVFPKGLLVGYYLGEGRVDAAVDFSALEDVFVRCAK